MQVTPYCDAIVSQFERQGFSDLKYAFYPKEILDSLCRFFIYPPVFLSVTVISFVKNR